MYQITEFISLPAHDSIDATKSICRECDPDEIAAVAHRHLQGEGRLFHLSPFPLRLYISSVGFIQSLWLLSEWRYPLLT